MTGLSGLAGEIVMPPTEPVVKRFRSSNRSGNVVLDRSQAAAGGILCEQADLVGHHLRDHRARRRYHW